MTRLLWKDYRESWPLGALLVACTMLCIHISGGYPIVNLWQPMNVWLSIPVAVGVLLGITAQTSDVSQPINSLMATLSAKASRAVMAHTITALTYVALSGLAGYCLFTITCPHAYRQLLQQDNPAYGTMACMVILAGAWYCGFCVRSLWSSIAAKLVVLLWLSLVALLIIIRMSIVNIVAMSAFSNIALLLLLLLPGVLLVINVRLKGRETRISMVAKSMMILVMALCIWKLVNLYQYAAVYNDTAQSVNRVSPTGEYAVIPKVTYDWRRGSYIQKTQIINLKTSAFITEINNTDAFDTSLWITNNSLALIGSIKGSPSFTFVKIMDNNRTSTTSQRLKFREFNAYGSADGRYILVASDPNRPMPLRLPADEEKEIQLLVHNRQATHPNGSMQITVKMSINYFRVFDTASGRWATKYIHMGHCQWADSKTISYTDFFGDGQMLRLPVAK